MIRHRFLPILFAVVALALFACDPLSPNPTAIFVVITPVASPTPPPTATFTPAPTATPAPTDTPDVPPTNTPFPCEEAGGQVFPIDENRGTVAGGENLRYNVYVPPCYLQTGVRYPVLYLIHGLASTEDQWVNLGVPEVLDQGQRLGVVAPMIVVMPYMGQIGTRNSFPPDTSYETVLLEELIPTIDRDFCTLSNRENRAIGGISRGGFWAYSVALRHPDRFGIVGGHSAFFPDDPREVPPAFSPLDLALNASFLAESNLRMYIDHGADDYTRGGLQTFSSRLSSRGIPHRYVINPVGDHTDEYWAAHVSEYITFYGENWSRNVGELPSCLEPSP